MYKAVDQQCGLSQLLLDHFNECLASLQTPSTTSQPTREWS